MAMPQRDDTIEAIKRLDALLEYAVMHGDEAEAERLRARGKPLCLAGRSRAGLILGDEAVELGYGVADGLRLAPLDRRGGIWYYTLALWGVALRVIPIEWTATCGAIRSPVIDLPFIREEKVFIF